MLPDFLVIGGMKCGSTSLYYDLAAHPDIALAEKELNLLTEPGADVASVHAGYAAAFGRSGSAQLRGDISTTYAMAPRFEAAALASRSLSRQTKIVYLVREPVSRAVSHHHHMHTLSTPDSMGPDINTSVKTRSEIVDYGCYARQLRPWRDAYADEQILVIRFEDYVNDRCGELDRLWNFLELRRLKQNNAELKVHNRSNGKPLLGPTWGAISTSPWYRRWVRPLVPSGVKRAAMGALFPPAPATFAPPNSETVETILSAAEEDEFELRSFMGANDPLWDWSSVRRDWSNLRQQYASSLRSVA